MLKSPKVRLISTLHSVKLGLNFISDKTVIKGNFIKNHESKYFQLRIFVQLMMNIHYMAKHDRPFTILDFF